MKAPSFITNYTPKQQYRKDLNMWIEMVNEYAAIDVKGKALQRTAGHLIYLSCDSTAREQLEQNINSGTISLKFSEDDRDRSLMISNILNIIAKDTPEDMVKREVDALTKIHSCERKPAETPSQYASRFCGAVARYHNESGNIGHVMDRQFAILMLRNAKLSQDTFNSIVLRLNTVAEKSVVRHDHIVVITEHFLDNLSKVLSGSMNDVLIDDCVDQVDKLKKRIKVTKSLNFTTQDVSSALSQVDERNAPSTMTSMIGKRFEKIQERGAKRGRSEFPCRVCGKIGHWYRDNSECRDKFRRRMDMINKVMKCKDEDVNKVISENHRSAPESLGNPRAAGSKTMTVNDSEAKGASGFSSGSQ